MLMGTITYLRAKLGSKKGQGLVEYGLIVGIIAVIIIAGLTVLKTPLQNLFNNIGGLLDDSGSQVVMPQ